MVRTIILLISVLFLLGIWSCDFFITSPFPDYLTTARKAANIGKYFTNSHPANYDMFVMQNNMAEEYVFVLYKPDETNRKVVVFDSDLNYVTQYLDLNLGSLHTGFLGGQRALAGSLNVELNTGTFTWYTETTANISPDQRDDLMIFNYASGPSIFYLLSVMTSGNDVQSYGHNDDMNLSANNIGDGSFQISSTGEEYILENGCYIDNGNPGDTTDDLIILFLRRRADNEGMAIGIPAATSMPAAEFPNTAISPILDNCQTYHFGKIKAGSVHIVFGGRGVILEHDGGEVNLYNIHIDALLNMYFDDMNHTNGRQFDDKVVAYSRFYSNYYVFDPSTKNLFWVGAWWE